MDSHQKLGFSDNSLCCIFQNNKEILIGRVLDETRILVLARVQKKDITTFLSVVLKSIKEAHELSCAQICPTTASTYMYVML